MPLTAPTITGWPLMATEAGIRACPTSTRHGSKPADDKPGQRQSPPKTHSDSNPVTILIRIASLTVHPLKSQLNSCAKGCILIRISTPQALLHAGIDTQPIVKGHNQPHRCRQDLLVIFGG